MRALVTGGCGFIGNHFVDRLVSESDDVRIVYVSSNVTMCLSSYTRGIFDISRLIELAQAGLYRVTWLPITELPLGEVNSGIEAIRTGQPGRILINMK